MLRGRKENTARAGREPWNRVDAAESREQFALIKSIIGSLETMKMEKRSSSIQGMYSTYNIEDLGISSINKVVFV